MGNWVSRKNDFVKKGYIIKVGHLSSFIGKQHGNKRMGFSSAPFNIDMFMWFDSFHKILIAIVIKVVFHVFCRR